jgi:hypothetical protein
MDNAIAGFLVLLTLVVAATLAALFATSTGVLYYQDQDRDQHYECHYMTATGTFTISIVSSSGCKLLATIDD